MRKVVITGGYGFIGSRFIQQMYLATDFKIINIDKCTYAADRSRVPSYIRDDEDRYVFLKLDIASSDLRKHPELDNVDYVVNFAAESHVDNSIEDGKPFMATNIGGVFNLLEFFRRRSNLKKFVQISTDEVYGDMEEQRGKVSATEAFPLKPSSYYSASKASADLLVKSAARTFGIPFLITRSCNNYGPGQHPEKFIPKALECLSKKKAVPVYGNGKQVREWIHVDDNVEIIYGLMLDDSVENEIFNIGSGKEYTNHEILDTIEEATGRSFIRESVTDRLGHDKAYRLDCTKLGSRHFAPWAYRGMKDFFNNEIEE